MTDVSSESNHVVQFTSHQLTQELEMLLLNCIFTSVFNKGIQFSIDLHCIEYMLKIL
jgi:hypothetical protein